MRRLWLLAFAASHLCACFSGVELPADATVACASNDECPAGTICAVALGRCVEQGQDTSPPGLVDGTLSQNVEAVGRSGVFRVSFVVSEALGVEPSVLLIQSGLDSGFRPMAMVSQSGREFTYEFEVSDPDGIDAGLEGSVSLRIDLNDEAGNPGRAEFPGVVLFDFTVPSLVTSEVSITDSLGSPRSELTVGSRVRASVVVSEAIEAQSEASIGSVLMDTASAVGTSYVFEHVLVATENYPQGQNSVVLNAVDLAGNSATFALGDVVVDTVPPEAPRVGDSNAVVLTRIPWGADSTDGEPGLSLNGAAGAAEPGTTVRVYDRSNPSNRIELGSRTVEADGSFGPVALGAFDLPRVFVEAVDTAGNMSDAVATRDGEWIASFVGARNASLLANPHRILQSVVRKNVQVDPDGFEVSNQEYAAVASIESSLAGSLSLSTAARWVQRVPDPLALQRGFTSWAHDRSSGLVWAFGGFSSIGFLSDTWEWNGERWRELPLNGAQPPVRAIAAMAFSDLDAVALLFGGLNANLTDIYGDSWIWDGTMWAEVTPVSGGPSPRAMHAVGYHRAEGKIVLFGGCSDFDCDTPLADTWVWELATGWSEVSSGPPPAGRAGHTMTYDSANDRILMFGGCTVDAINSCDNELGDLWAFDGSAWSEISFSAPAPSPRTLASATFDEESETLFIYGGNTGSTELWEWEPIGGWVDRSASSGEPEPRERGTAVMYYDAPEERLIVFGGRDGDTALGDTWQWRDGWVRLGGPGLEPIERSLLAMTYDPTVGKSVVFGGEGESGEDCDEASGRTCDGTWTWDGGVWEFADPSPSPAGLEAASMTFHSGLGQSVLFGGETDAGNEQDILWSYNAETATWTRRCWPSLGCSPSPPALRETSIAYDSNRDELVLFGGANNFDVFGQTWTWSSTTGWSRYCSVCEAPPVRRGGAMAYDAGRRRVVLYGGLSTTGGCIEDSRSCDQTWEWDGSG
ncbi:MAG: kelch repeat-containing protein, partial [Myxococcota bacterium]